jgi:xanthine/CO dehydrogenase XdhC/CoxF family maturation factor
VTLFDDVRAVAEDGGRAVVFTIIAGDDVGAKLLVHEDGSTAGDAPADLAALAEAALRTGRSHVIEHDGLTVFAPPPRGSQAPTSCSWSGPRTPSPRWRRISAPRSSF